jgi:hypothetical protein
MEVGVRKTDRVGGKERGMTVRQSIHAKEKERERWGEKDVIA